MAYTFEEAKTEIRVIRKKGGPYWHNSVGFIVLQVAEEMGANEANRLIRECHLKDAGWREEPVEEVI